MAKNIDVLEVLQKLPEMCMTRSPGDNKPILVRRGVKGYWPWKDWWTDAEIDAFNARHGVTAIQQECMLIGSMFGWDVPGANPDNYETKAVWKGEK